MLVAVAENYMGFSNCEKTMQFIVGINQGCPTGVPRAGCGPQPTYLWPSKA